MRLLRSASGASGGGAVQSCFCRRGPRLDLLALHAAPHCIAPQGARMITVIASTYGIIGLVLSVVGPAARQLKREVAGLESMHDIPSWKRHAFRLAIGTAILLLWPILLPAAARRERVDPPFHPLHEGSANPTPRAQKQIRRIMAAPPRTISLDEYRSIGDGFSWFDRPFLESAMAERGYLVAMARTDKAEAIPVRFAVASYIGQPIVLEKDSDGRWGFTTELDSWEHLAGCSGIAEIRDGVVESVDVLSRN